MKKIIKNTLAALMAFAVAFTGIPVLAGGFSVDAASTAPAQVKEIKVEYSHNYVRLRWIKVKTKGLSGYTVFRGGKALKSVSAKNLTYKDTKVKASKKYSYYVRAYKNVKQKRYFNSKTKKWQADKPAAKNWKGKKTKTVTVKKYGKASPTMKVKTLVAPKKTSSKKKTTKKTTSKPKTETSGWNYSMSISKASNIISFKLSKVSADTKVEIYRGSDWNGVLKDTSTTAEDKNLKANTEYSYSIKVYYKGKLKKTETKKVKTAEGPKKTTTTTTTNTATDIQ